MGAVAGLEDDDGGHQRGGEAEGEGMCVFEGHRSGSCFERRAIPRWQAPDVSD
jgi:hypothetical protein